MRRLTALLLTAAVLLLAGCAEAPPEPPTGTAVAAAPLPVATQGHALVVVYRDGIAPDHHPVTLYVGGIEAADIDEAQYTLISLPPGKTRLESGWSFMEFLDAPGFADLDLQAGKTYYFRVTSGATWLGAVGIVPVVAGLEASAPTPVGAAIIGAGAVLLSVDEVEARRTGRALEPRSDEDATRDIARCSYVPAAHGFMQAAAPADNH